MSENRVLGTRDKILTLPMGTYILKSYTLPYSLGSGIGVWVQVTLPIAQPSFTCYKKIRFLRNFVKHNNSEKVL